MTLAIHTEPTPLTTGPDGVVRVSGTRVTLDTIVIAFNQGATAEEIAQQYPSVTLAQAYSVISYYLTHREQVDAYLGERAQESKAIRESNEARCDQTRIRERLMARRSAGK